MKVNQQLFQTTADGKLMRRESEKKEGAPDTGRCLLGGIELELGILITSAHACETYRLPEHIHSGDIRGWGWRLTRGRICKNRDRERSSLSDSRKQHGTLSSPNTLHEIRSTIVLLNKEKTTTTMT